MKGDRVTMRKTGGQHHPHTLSPCHVLSHRHSGPTAEIQADGRTSRARCIPGR